MDDYTKIEKIGEGKYGEQWAFKCSSLSYEASQNICALCLLQETLRFNQVAK